VLDWAAPGSKPEESGADCRQGVPVAHLRVLWQVGGPHEGSGVCRHARSHPRARLGPGADARTGVEGHIPADLVTKLLRERPKIAGIAAPGMPLGSPGMESPNPQPYVIVAFRADGTVYEFARR
jgi:hypothetical protein